MKKYIVQIILFVLFVTFGCKSRHPLYSVDFGKYSFNYSIDKKEKDELIIKADSTFTLILSGRYVNSSCIGNWQFVDKNTIQLECGPSKTSIESLSFDYIKERRRLIKIIDSNTLEMPVFNNETKKSIFLKKDKE